MRNPRYRIWIVAAFLLAVPAIAKQNKEASNVFDAPADRVYDAVYRYAQHHGTIKYSSDKHRTISAVIYIPGGHWSYRKDFDCTISVETSEGNKSVVDIVGVAKSKHASVSDVFGKGPVAKVIDGIRKELEQQK